MIGKAYQKILRRQLPLILLIILLLGALLVIFGIVGENPFAAASPSVGILFSLLLVGPIIATLASLRPVWAFGRELSALSPTLRERVEADFNQCEQVGPFYFTRDFLVLHHYRGGPMADFACIPYGTVDSIDVSTDRAGVQETILRAGGTVRRIPRNLPLTEEDVSELQALLTRAKRGEVDVRPRDDGELDARRARARQRTMEGVRRSPLFSILYSFVLLFLYPTGMLGVLGLANYLGRSSAPTAQGHLLFWPNLLFLVLTLVVVGANLLGLFSFLRKMERPPSFLTLMTLFFFLFTTAFILFIAYAYGESENILGRMATGFSLLFGG